VSLRLAGLLALALGVAVTPLPAQQGAADDSLRIRFLDVGQADAILVQLGRKAVLVDASRGDDIVLYLEAEGVDSLVAAIASHNHADHIGGMDAVLESWPVAAWYSNGHPPVTEKDDDVVARLRERKTPAPAPPWTPLQLGDVRITLWSPPPFDPAGLDPGEIENNSSLGVLVERGRFKALLTGDSQREELAAWLAARKVPDVDVLKAAHHGSRNGVIPGWINATRPEVVVISVGAGNTYGHPEEEALRYYRSGGRMVLRTDRDGTVTIAVAPGGQYRISTRLPLAR
jgi:beta-lactamase superfamily II metal-dependent hydrolase